jgi:hypothetical protein
MGPLGRGRNASGDERVVPAAAGRLAKVVMTVVRARARMSSREAACLS